MVGQTVEKADIADLEAAVTGLTADVRQLHTTCSPSRGIT